MKSSKGGSRFKVSADGKGVVSHAGTALLRELAYDSGLVDGWTDALIGTYDGPPIHMPGQVLADLAVAIADGGTALSHLRTLRDQDQLFGSVACDATAWRVLERVNPAKLAEIRAARVAARATVWAVGGGPGRVAAPGECGQQHRGRSRRGPRPRWPRCPNTPAPRPGQADGPKVLVSADTAGATHAFAKALRERGAGFSLGFPIDVRVQNAINTLPEKAWTSAYNRDGLPRRGAWVAEITDLLDLDTWPAGSRVIVRRERPEDRNPATGATAADSARPPDEPRLESQ